MEVGLSVLLQPVDNGVISNLEFTSFYLFLLLNFKPCFVMLSDVMCGKESKSFTFGTDPIVSVVISNYPLSNGGYLVSFGKDESDGSFKNFDPSQSMFFEGSILSDILEFWSRTLYQKWEVNALFICKPPENQGIKGFRTIKNR